MTVKHLCCCLLLSMATLAIGTPAALAAEGDIDREGSVVYITGDAWNDYCEIFIDGDEIKIEISVHDADGELDDFEDRDYDLDEITLVVFEGGSGDDDFWNNTSVPSIAYGGAGDDLMVGGFGDDQLYGDSGEDSLYGRSGDDDLYGGGDPDWVVGGSDNDYLKAGTGEDEHVITGQTGNDIFANPGTTSWWSRYLVPIDRDVLYYDFDPSEDIEVLFYAPMLSIPVTPILLP